MVWRSETEHHLLGLLLVIKELLKEAARSYSASVGCCFRVCNEQFILGTGDSYIGQTVFLLNIYLIVG